MIRIRYQSFVDEALGGPYLERLRAHLEVVSDADTTVEVVQMSPPAAQAHPLVELRCGYRAIANAIDAARQGADAFAIGHFQDAGLAEAKAAAEIPVMGLGETSMLFACTLGRKIGLVTINPKFIPWHEEQIVRYGLEKRVVGVHAMSFNPGDFMRAFTSERARREVVASFRAQAEPLVAAGVDVLVPAGGIPMLVLAQERDFRIDGVPVLDGVAVLVKLTAAAVRLKRLNGTAVSRTGPFVAPEPTSIDEFLAGP